MTILKLFDHQLPETSMSLNESVRQARSGYKSPLWNLWHESSFHSITMLVNGTNSVDQWTSLEVVFKVSPAATNTTWFSKNNVAGVKLNGVLVIDPIPTYFYFHTHAVHYRIGSCRDFLFISTYWNKCSLGQSGTFINTDFPMKKSANIIMKLDNVTVIFRAKLPKNRRFFTI